MLTIIWKETALDELAEIISFIAEVNPDAATKLYEKIKAAILPAAEHPYLFRSGRVEGTREVIAHPNYLLVYEVGIDRIEVVAVLHARQQYPR